MKAIPSYKWVVQERLFLDVGQLKAEVLLLVHNLQDETDEECSHTEACQHNERCGVVELCGVCHTLVGGVEHLTDEEREEPQADILNPEDQRVG